MDAIGFIYLISPSGVDYPWCVSCHPDDTAETLKKHAEKWKPGWYFVGAEVLHYNQSLDSDG
jgi:hypothetical protein